MNLNGAISKIFTLSQQQITIMYLQGLNEVVNQNQWLKKCFLAKPKGNFKKYLEFSTSSETDFSEHSVTGVCECDLCICVKERKNRHLIQMTLNKSKKKNWFPAPTSLLTFKQTSSSRSATALGTKIALLEPLRDRIAFRTKRCFLISIDRACSQIALLPGRSLDELLKNTI